MADNIPIAASGPREPAKRPRPIPKVVRDACLLMVYGDPDADDDGVPLDFISAAKQVGIRPNTLRRYLARPQVIALLRAERRAFREAICASNEGALRRVRDGDSHANPMARVAAVRALEQLNDEAGRPGGTAREVSPGYVIQVNVSTAPAALPTGTAPALLEHAPAAESFSDLDVLWLDGRNERGEEAE